MAQIIKHRRGSLEAVSSATKRAGELLVVTGSAGITATNGNSILFVGIDGSTVTPANKILQGTSTPDLTGATYDTSIDGIPFYNTSTEKLYIVNKGGNVEVKATANTGGTGIVSGSTQVAALLPTGTISSSAQVDADSITNFDSNVKSKLDADGVISGSAGIIPLLPTGTVSGSSQISYASISSIPAGIVSGSSQILGGSGIFSGSSQVDADSITNFDENVKAKLDADGVISGSAGIIPLLPTGTVSGSSQVNADSITNFDENVKAKLDADGVISGSAGIIPLLPTGTVSGSSQVTGILSALNTFSGSQETKNSTLATYTASVDVAISALNAVSHSHSNKANLDTINQDLGTTSIVEFSSLKTSGTGSIGTNLTVYGNLTVWGTQSIINSENLAVSDNMIYLNNNSTITNPDLGIAGNYNDGTYAHSGIFSDASDNHAWKVYKGYTLEPSGAIDTSHGSFTLADFKAGAFTGTSFNGTINSNNGVVSGSSQVDATSTTNWSTGIKTQLNSNTVISGSSQVDITATTGYSTFSGSVATAISASVAASDWANINNKPAGIVSGSAQIVANLSGSNLNLAGISGSSLNITGNAKIDGNVVIGGNITIGDTTTDTVSFTADLTSNIIPSASNTYDLGSSSKVFANVYATNLYGAIKATNGVVSGSSQILGGSGIVSGSSQITLIDTTGFIGYSGSVATAISASTAAATWTNLNGKPEGIVSGSSQLNNTSITGLHLDTLQATGSFSGSFVGDGSSLTGIDTLLVISGSTGNHIIDLKYEALHIVGSGPISSSVLGADGFTIGIADASTTSKGAASFASTNFDVISGNVTIKSGGVTAATLNAGVAGTGLSLDGGDNSLKVDYGSTSGTAVEGNTSLTVQGTANEIEISGGSITLGSGGTVTIGLPDNVTISGSLTANGNVFLGNSTADSVTIAGNLYVQGTTTTVDSTTVQIGDNVLELNGSGAANGGLLVKDVTNPNTASGSLLWDSTTDYWKAGALGSEKELARFSGTPTSGSVQTIGANGLFVNSQISDDAIKVTIGTDLVINGLTANSFVVSNGSKKLISVTPSNAGDLIQWNGSSFVASNELDGGTF